MKTKYLLLSFVGCLVFCGVLVTGLNLLIIRHERCPNYYSSPCIPFWMTAPEDGKTPSPEYKAFERLNSAEYWDHLSAQTQTEAEAYGHRLGIRGLEVHVRCVGRATGYEVFYSVGGKCPFIGKDPKDKVDAFIVEYVRKAYQKSLQEVLPDTEW